MITKYKNKRNYTQKDNGIIEVQGTWSPTPYIDNSKHCSKTPETMEAQKLNAKKRALENQISDIVYEFLKDVGECSIEGKINTYHSEIRDGKHVNVQIDVRI